VLGIAITSLLAGVTARAIRRAGPPSGPYARRREYTRRTEYVPTEPMDIPPSRIPGQRDY
jgi:hypothetical protein